MTDPQVLQNAQMSTGGFSALPMDWEERATRRLAWLAVAAAIAAAIALLMLPFRQPNVGGIRDGHERPIIVIPIILVVSSAVYLIARRQSIPALRRLDAGLVWLCAMCGAGAVFRHWLPYAATDVVRGPSIISLAVLFFAAMVPVRPSRMLAAAAVAALMDPLALVMAILVRDNPVPRFNMWLWLFVPGTVACAISVMASRTLHALGRTVQRAHEMGSYRLIERLGKGGMGEVWLARHHTLARPAAIKLINREALGEQTEDRTRDLMRRFELEAQATANLNSPHTIQVYDFGISRDGSFYYVMELLDGLDLATLVERHGAQPQERVAHILLQACHSLTDAHEAGMVHRDIKPANIYLCRKGLDRDVVKVLDFGLVKFQAPDGIDETAETGIAGTPAYLPPEMAEGKGLLDARADIYSLGCVAFWLLTGEPVFTTANLFDLIRAHVEASPRKPSEVSQTPVDPRLEALVMQCLEKSPGDRPESCEALAGELRALDLHTAWTNELATGWWSEHADAPAVDPDADTHSSTGGSASTFLLETLPNLRD